MKIGFSSTKGYWVSRGVIFFTKMDARVKPCISHAFPILGPFKGMELALSSDEFMTNIVDINRYRVPNKIFRVWELPEPFDKPADGWEQLLVRKYNQKIYPHLELAWFIYRWVRRLFNKDWIGKNPLDYSVFCSELTIKALVLAGYSDFSKLDANSTDAIQLENVIMNYPGAKLIESHPKINVYN